jgi:murein DD-endopeptidase MepM/ murein hydrolase activator NlpD
MNKWISLCALLLISFTSFSFDVAPARTAISIKSVSKSLAFPVAGSSRIRDKWGASRGGGIRKHKGIDIHARKGTPVVAVCDGVIVEKALTPIGGKTLWLRSEDYGWKAYYAHLDKQLVREGQHVKKGQVIGTVGNTGNARTTPSHLHYGISSGDDWVNPLPYVKYSPKVSVKKSSKKKSGTKRKPVASRKKRR